jgi:hypothetical protein
MATLEEIGTDPATADGWVAVMQYNSAYDLVVGVPLSPKWRSLGRLRRSFESIMHTRGVQTVLKIESRKGSKGIQRVYEISFLLLKKQDEVICLFLECMRQSNIMANPIVSDLRNRDWK